MSVAVAAAAASGISGWRDGEEVGQWLFGKIVVLWYDYDEYEADDE